MTFLKAVAFYMTLFSSAVSAKQSAILKEEFIFKKPPFKSCHASTIAQAKDQTLLCSYFAGSEEGNSDVDIWISKNENGVWSKPKIAATSEVPLWNPVLFTYPNGDIYLFYKEGKSFLYWSGSFKVSHDNGNTWSEQVDLPAGINGPIKNKPILANDVLLCGSSVESYHRWGSYVEITRDHGKTWTRSNPINLPNDLFGIIQPTIFQLDDGSFKILTRSRKTGKICEASSQDGIHWSDAQETSLLNPNSGIDAVTLKDGRVLLVFNNSKKSRTPLNLAISSDNAKTWQLSLTLEFKPGEFSYPAIIQSDDGLVHITYTYNRKNIKHVVIDPQYL
ncbi:MAG: sialidase [Chlamydiae bacterium CG10_big_fil_rev_8_21_14_0_10_35_9]|nr:MAG: sialidase [Chlamydiae bacterium CG10_big_fil_rev_8_21_14_0_10_35_9]